MSKLFRSSIILMFFAFAMTFFQLSCTRESFAGPLGETSNNVLYRMGDYVESVKVYSINLESPLIQSEVNISWESSGVSNKEILDMSVSKDGSLIVFKLKDRGDATFGIYVCSISGGNLTTILEFGSEEPEDIVNY